MGINVRKILAVLTVGAGMCLMLYPWISNWAYCHSVGSEVDVYEKETAGSDPGLLNSMLEDAVLYNEQISDAGITLTDPFVLSEEESEDIVYDSVLSMNDEGLMCFVDIPKIDVYLPVYHGTSEEVLRKGVGHLEGSALPVGGEGTRAVLSAHTGINSSRMFTDLTQMEAGDLFFIHVLGGTLAYRVCDIKVILPEDTGSLVPEEGRDLVSLLTCTPYGVNSHRLVVTGERTEYTDDAKTEADSEISDTGSQWMKEYRKAVLIGLAAVVIFAVTVKLCRYAAGKGKVDRDKEGTV